MADMTPLDKAKALLDARRKATQGEWEHTNDGESIHPPANSGFNGLCICTMPQAETYKEQDRNSVNFDFIVLAANHAEAICTRLVELEKNYPVYKAHYDLCFPPKGTPASEIETLHDEFLTARDNRLIELEAIVHKVREAIESSKEYASLAYCSGSDTSKRQECLGWEAKVACGSFGAPEFECHRMANNWFGQHRGAWNVINALVDAMRTENAELRARLEEKG